MLAKLCIWQKNCYVQDDLKTNPFTVHFHIRKQSFSLNFSKIYDNIYAINVLHDFVVCKNADAHIQHNTRVITNYPPTTMRLCVKLFTMRWYKQESSKFWPDRNLFYVLLKYANRRHSTDDNTNNANICPYNNSK